jgi:hypothetical protein
MKTIIKNILVFAILLGSIYSCTDESTFRNPVHHDLSKDGAFPKLQDELQETVGVSSLDQLVYNFTVIDPNNSIASYDLKLSATLNGSSTPEYDVATVTSFPANFSFTAQDFADILQVNVSDFSFGDSFHFTGSAISSKNGLLYDAVTNTEPTLLTPGYRNAFDFSFTVLCPNGPTVDDIVGVWAITSDDFGIVIDDGIFQVVAGPGDNQVTFIDPFGHYNLNTGDHFDIVMDIDTENHKGYFARQDSWDSGIYGLPYGIGRNEGEGTIFNCIGNGFMKFTFQYTVDAGSFGSYGMEFTKL